MITEKNFIVPIYGFKVSVVVFDNPKEVQEKYSEFFTPSMNACTVDYIGCSKAKLIIPSSDYGSVIHELEHVKNSIWKATGYRPQADNDEPDAYLICYLYDRVDKIIKDHLASK